MLAQPRLRRAGRLRCQWAAPPAPGSPLVKTFEMQVEPMRSAVPVARRFARARARELGLGDCADLVELLVSEVVTNAVLHAEAPVRLRVIWDGGQALRLEVSDGSSARPSLKNYGPEAVTGRGVGLVAAFAQDWGIKMEADGKTVWFTVNASG